MSSVTMRASTISRLNVTKDIKLHCWNTSVTTNVVQKFASVSSVRSLSRPIAGPQLLFPSLLSGGRTYRNLKVFAQQSVDTLVPPVELANADNPLILKANAFIHTQSGFYSDPVDDVFSEDFVFRGPYIGPLNKADYLKTMNIFKIWEALPDIAPNAFGFSVDPKDPNRVWFIVRNTGTFTGKPGIGLGNGQFFAPNGASLEGCPETFSLTFDEDQKLKHMTVGYVADRFEGNTNGTGAAVGIFNAIGFSFPRPGLILRILQWFGTEVISSGPLSYSKDVPSWWKSESKGSQGYQ